jgi:hypothetical protein
MKLEEFAPGMVARHITPEEEEALMADTLAARKFAKKYAARVRACEGLRVTGCAGYLLGDRT